MSAASVAANQFSESGQFRLTAHAKTSLPFRVGTPLLVRSFRGSAGAQVERQIDYRGKKIPILERSW